MDDRGWISLHRQIKKHWLWKDPVKFQWWIDILLSVNHTPEKVNLGNDLVDCGRGQSVKSLQTWAMEWKTSKDTVRNFFKLLQKDKMILLENIKISTRLTVCKYDSYQIDLHAKQTVPKREANDNQTQPHPNNNDNNENKKDIPPTPPTEKKITFEESVRLTEKEHEKLLKDYGEERTAWLLRRLGNYKKSKGAKYKSDYAAIHTWVIDAMNKDFTPTKADKKMVL